MGKEYGSLEIRWNLKSKLLAFVITEGLPTDGDELKEMCNFTFGKECIFENVDKIRKKNHEVKY
jgi:hypothetical protein